VKTVKKPGDRGRGSGDRRRQTIGPKYWRGKASDL
jgi:hypothetical protein